MSLELLANHLIYLDGRLYDKTTELLRDTYIMNAGYRRVKYSISGVVYTQLAHRLIWFMHYGAIPEGMQVDHINRDKLDNSIENLRLVTHSGNMQNSRGAGTTFDKRVGKYHSRIYLDGKRYSLGYHETDYAARAAYLKAKSKLHTFASAGVLQ